MTFKQKFHLGLMAVLFSCIAVAQSAELNVGDLAPNFSLMASDGQRYSLADYKDKQAVALAFFPKAFTGG